MRTSLAACVLLVGGILGLETARAADEDPEIDVTALPADSKREGRWYEASMLLCSS